MIADRFRVAAWRSPAQPLSSARPAISNPSGGNLRLLLAFLRDMPKGGDLHIHLGGAIYAESLIDYAVSDNLVRRPDDFGFDRASVR